MLTFNLMSSSAMACAIPRPSTGDVPRPSSSTSTSVFGVAMPEGFQYEDRHFKLYMIQT